MSVPVHCGLPLLPCAVVGTGLKLRSAAYKEGHANGHATGHALGFAKGSKLEGGRREVAQGARGAPAARADGAWDGAWDGPREWPAGGGAALLARGLEPGAAGRRALEEVAETFFHACQVGRRASMAGNRPFYSFFVSMGIGGPQGYFASFVPLLCTRRPRKKGTQKKKKQRLRKLLCWCPQKGAPVLVAHARACVCACAHVRGVVKMWRKRCCAVCSSAHERPSGGLPLPRPPPSSFFVPAGHAGGPPRPGSALAGRAGRALVGPPEKTRRPRPAVAGASRRRGGGGGVKGGAHSGARS